MRPTQVHSHEEPHRVKHGGVLQHAARHLEHAEKLFTKTARCAARAWREGQATKHAAMAPAQERTVTRTSSRTLSADTVLLRMYHKEREEPSTPVQVQPQG